MSSLQVWNGPICIAQTETYAMNSVSLVGADFNNNAAKRGQASIFVIVLCVLGGLFAVILVMFLILFGLRRYRIAKVKLQSRRYSRNRRRSR